MQPVSYPSDLTEQEWAILEPLIPPAKPGGHPRTTNMREVINVILYLDRTGCQWQAVPWANPYHWHNMACNEFLWNASAPGGVDVCIGPNT